MLAEQVEVVIGVDTHKHTHTAAVVAAASGAVLAQLTVNTDPAGYQALVELTEQHRTLRAWAMEGSGGWRWAGRPSRRARRAGHRASPPGPPGAAGGSE